MSALSPPLPHRALFFAHQRRPCTFCVFIFSCYQSFFLHREQAWSFVIRTILTKSSNSGDNDKILFPELGDGRSIQVSISYSVGVFSSLERIL